MRGIKKGHAIRYKKDVEGMINGECVSLRELEVGLYMVR